MPLIAVKGRSERGSRTQSDKSLRGQLIRSFIGVGAMKLLSLPIGLLTSIILARTLGPESFGKYTFVMASVPLLALPIVAGVPPLLTRQVAVYSHASHWSLYRGIVRVAHYWVIGFSIVVLGLFILGGPITGLLSLEGKWGLLSIGIFLIPFIGLNAVRKGTIKGLGLPAYAELPTQLIQPVIILAAFSFMTIFDVLTTISAVWTQIFAGAITFLTASLIFIRVRPKNIVEYRPVYETKIWATMLLPFTLITLVSTFNTRLGIVFLGIIGTDESVAAMRVAERGAQFVAISLHLVNMVISPHIVKNYRDGDTSKLQQLSRQAARGAFIIALPIGISLILFGKKLISVTFGEEYAIISYTPLIILAFSHLLNVFFGSVGQFLSMSGHERDTLFGQIGSLIISIAAFIILIPLYGALGAAIGLGIGIVTWNIIMGILVFKRLKIWPTAI